MTLPFPTLRRLPALAAALVLAAAAAGCRTPGAFVPVEEYPQAQPDAEYRIGVGDVLSVRVFNQEAMSTAHARVRDDGKVSVPFLQDVDVAGITPAELSQRLQTRLKAFVVNPVVTITVEEVRPLRVSVLGEVAHPGQYDLDRRGGVLAALAAAGGLTDFAHRDELFVLRTTPGEPRPARIRFRYEALVRGDRAAAGFVLRSGDVVVAE